MSSKEMIRGQRCESCHPDGLPTVRRVGRRRRSRGGWGRRCWLLYWYAAQIAAAQNGEAHATSSDQSLNTCGRWKCVLACGPRIAPSAAQARPHAPGPELDPGALSRHCACICGCKWHFEPEAAAASAVAVQANGTAVPCSRTGDQTPASDLQQKSGSITCLVSSEAGSRRRTSHPPSPRHRHGTRSTPDLGSLPGWALCAPGAYPGGCCWG